MRFVETRPGLGTGRTLLGGRVVSMGYVGDAGKGKEKWLALNIGYDSDEGGGSRSHSKSVGSGRDTGRGVGHMAVTLGASSSPWALALCTFLVRPDPLTVSPHLSQLRKIVFATDDSEDYETEMGTDGVRERELRGRDLPVGKGNWLPLFTGRQVRRWWSPRRGRWRVSQRGDGIQRRETRCV